MIAADINKEEHQILLRSKKLNSAHETEVRSLPAEEFCTFQTIFTTSASIYQHNALTEGHSHLALLS